MDTALFFLTVLGAFFAAPALLLLLVVKASRTDTPKPIAYYLMLLLWTLCAMLTGYIIVSTGSELLSGSVNFKTLRMNIAKTYDLQSDPIQFFLVAVTYVATWLLLIKCTFRMFLEWRKLRTPAEKKQDDKQ